jgi:hypothetical protein
MKIYDTYRVLFESYTDLISEELLDEVMWVSNKESKLTRGEIPLTSSIVKIMKTPIFISKTQLITLNVWLVLMRVEKRYVTYLETNENITII